MTAGEGDLLSPLEDVEGFCLTLTFKKVVNKKANYPVCLPLKGLSDGCYVTRYSNKARLIFKL